MFRVRSRLLGRTSAMLLVGAGLASLPAGTNAVSGAIFYDCYVYFPGPLLVFEARIDTDAPDTLGTGVTRPITVTATVQIPEALADALRSGGATSVTGTAEAIGVVNGVERQVTLTIPSTPVPADGFPMQVVGTGPAGTLTGGDVGAGIELVAGGLAPALTAYGSGGGVVAGYQFLCGLQPSQNLFVDSVVTVRAGTRAHLTAPYRAAKDKVVARTQLTSRSFVDITGKVRYVLKRNGVKLRTATVALNDADVGKQVFANIAKPGKYVLIARYLGSATMKPSEDRVRFGVSR
jgi:hypothetical protein